MVGEKEIVLKSGHTEKQHLPRMGSLFGANTNFGYIIFRNVKNCFDFLTFVFVQIFYTLPMHESLYQLFWGINSNRFHVN